MSVEFEDSSGAIAKAIIEDEVRQTDFYQSLSDEQRQRFEQVAHNLVLIGMESRDGMIDYGSDYHSPEEQLSRETRIYMLGMRDQNRVLREEF